MNQRNHVYLILFLTATILGKDATVHGALRGTIDDPEGALRETSLRHTDAELLDSFDNLRSNLSVGLEVWDILRDEDDAETANPYFSTMYYYYAV